MKFSILSAVFSGSLVFAADFYVSSSGSDSSSGSSSDPFKTLTKAQQTVRSLIAASLSEDVTIHIADGLYSLTSPLLFTTADSGNNGHTVNWKADGSNAVISGGIKITGWTQGTNGVYSASVPAGTKSRNLYVGGKASNYARKKIANRKDFGYTSSGMSWTNSQYDWLQNTAGIAGAEIRFINSFTDRYSPIQSVSNRKLTMVQNAWNNNLIGYDTVSNYNADFGVWVQNALALLTEGGQFYLDSSAGRVYYKPLNGENMATIDAYLGVQECLIAVGNSYNDPAHDISFSGLNFAHTTWMTPSTSGYVDQQTGAYIGENKVYPQFEAARPYWYQMPSAIQISAAKNIAFSGGSYTQLGGGGVGIGNDNNAHISGVGLGAKNVSVTDAFFTQVMGNSITSGGVQAPAHHPANANMINSQILIANNIFTNVSSLFSSTVSILATYVQYSKISHNDLYQVPYSGICHGYGWGSNDAGGSSEYQNRGLYNYQPKYTTPTISQNNVVEANLIHQFGLSHTDLGALYTLSKSPSSQINENYAYDAGGFGVYTDEGSNSYTIQRNVLMSNGIWSAVNGVNTANNSYISNWFKNGGARSGNTQIQSVSQASVEGQRAAYRAGVTPGKRGGRQVTNPTLPDGYLGISCSGGTLSLTLWNFDDSPFTGVTFSATANGASLSPSNIPTGVNGNTWTQATYKVSNGQCPSFSASVQYKNSRTGANANVNGVNATPPGGSPPGGSTGTGGSGGTPTTTGGGGNGGGGGTTPTPTTNPGTGTCSGLYGQCAGMGWTGPKCCSQGTCKFSNDYYSQCL